MSVNGDTRQHCPFCGQNYYVTVGHNCPGDLRLGDTTAGGHFPDNQLIGFGGRVVLENERYVGDLLAVIHGDGGHYQGEHGTHQAVYDAINKYYDMRGKFETMALEREQHLRTINDQLATIAVLELKLKEIRALAAAQGIMDVLAIVDGDL